MNYGLWLSATGVVTNTYRQDVIANNMANVETVGFKRNVPLFQQRLTEAQQRRQPDQSDEQLERLGGGLLCSPTLVDNTPGELETTGNKLDVAVQGEGYLAVADGEGHKFLTRDGRMALDRDGRLILATSGQHVLDSKGEPVALPVGVAPSELEITTDGQISREGQTLTKIGLFDVPDPSRLIKQGGTMLDYPDLATSMKPADPGGTQLHSGFVERSNVDPATELAVLMDAQRQLEANANMIKYQDQTMARLVNDVGKIG
jgi:flagellar basal-body rod protein FlgF